jgi:ABC-type uncharacterized transport system involved in gliding motility auxiliary subunit
MKLHGLIATTDEDLMSIRPKPEDDRTIAMSGPQLNTAIWVSQALLPLAVVVWGILVWVKRSRSNGGAARAKA